MIGFLQYIKDTNQGNMLGIDIIIAVLDSCGFAQQKSRFHQPATCYNINSEGGSMQTRLTMFALQLVCLCSNTIDFPNTDFHPQLTTPLQLIAVNISIDDDPINVLVMNISLGHVTITSKPDYGNMLFLVLSDQFVLHVNVLLLFKNMANTRVSYPK